MKTQPVHNPNAPDDENPEWTAATFAKAVPFAGLPASLQTKLRSPGRPKLAVTKEAISLRLAPDVVAAWRASGVGWQTRMAAVLTRAAPECERTKRAGGSHTR